MAIPDLRWLVLDGDMCACGDPCLVLLVRNMNPAAYFYHNGFLLECCGSRTAPPISAAALRSEASNLLVLLYGSGVMFKQKLPVVAYSASRQLWEMKRRKRLLFVRSKRALRVFVPLRACCRESSRRHCIRVRICRLLVRRHRP